MEVIYFNQKIRQGIYNLPSPAGQKAANMIDLLKRHGHRLSMPYSKLLTTNLFELRIKGLRQLRILYCFHDNRAVILHSFYKKTQTTPRREIKLAIKRRSLLTSQ